MATAGLTYHGVVPVDNYPKNYAAIVYRTRIGDDTITTTVTNSPVEILQWTVQAKERITASRCIGLTIKTAQWRNSTPRAVICAFSVGDICLIVRLSKKSKAIPSPVSDFLFQGTKVFAGISIQDSLNTLLQGIKGDRRPVFCDIKRAVDRYNSPYLAVANQHILATVILKQIPTYPRFFDTNFDKEWGHLEDTQIGAVTVDTYLAFLMGQELLGPEQGMKDKVKMEKGEGPEKESEEEEKGGRPEKRVKMEKEGGA